MRVGQIVAYVSEDGAFGGPVAVAVAQSSELSRLGHEVELIAGWDGRYKFGETKFRTRLFKAKKFGNKLTGLYSISLLKYIWRAKNHIDVLHVHLGRDLITMLAATIARWRGIPFVVQTHGMIMPDQRPLSRMFDALLTRRTIARSHAVLTLSDTETQGISKVALRRPNTELLTNGVQVEMSPLNRGDGPAQVVFLARLHPRKRVLIFAQAAASLRRAGRDAEFLIYGPDEGDLPKLNSYLQSEDLSGIRYEGALFPGTAHTVLSRASVYVLPSFGEVVPMTILESMAVGTPVVMTSDCAMANTLSEAKAAMVTDGSVSAVASSIAALLDDREMATLMAYRARELLRSAYSVEAVVKRVETIYVSAKNG